MINVFRNSEIEELQAVVEVNCSRRNLTTLPEFLPKYARILKVQQNMIEDLSPLTKNPIYRDVTDLYIDHNLIHTIDLLEGSFWLRNFRVLSLKGNNLSEVVSPLRLICTEFNLNCFNFKVTNLRYG